MFLCLYIHITSHCAPVTLNTHTQKCNTVSFHFLHNGTCNKITTQSTHKHMHTCKAAAVTVFNGCNLTLASVCSINSVGHRTPSSIMNKNPQNAFVGTGCLVLVHTVMTSSKPKIFQIFFSFFQNLFKN